MLPLSVFQFWGKDFLDFALSCHMVANQRFLRFYPFLPHDCQSIGYQKYKPVDKVASPGAEYENSNRADKTIDCNQLEAVRLRMMIINEDYDEDDDD